MTNSLIGTLENNKKATNDPLYKKILEERMSWDNWKKEAYNKMFAISKHAKKLPIK